MMKFEYIRTLNPGNDYTKPMRKFAFCRRIINQDTGFMERIENYTEFGTQISESTNLNYMAEIETGTTKFKCKPLTGFTTDAYTLNTVYNNLWFDPEL